MITKFVRPDTLTVRRMVLERGYKWFENRSRPYNLNIVGIRVLDPTWDQFNDWLVVSWPEPGTGSIIWRQFIAKITTLPGDYYSRTRLLNPGGVAILKGGQYTGCYQIAKHSGKYDALCQRLGPVAVYRDKNRNKNWDLDPATVKWGMFGINVHDSPDGIVTPRIGLYSAGCQVFQKDLDFKEFMQLVKHARVEWGNRFTYTLIDLLEETRQGGQNVT